MHSLYVVDGAAITAVGHDLPRTFASLRAGLSMFSELPIDGVSERPLQGAPVVGYAEGLQGVARYEALALRALVPIVSRIPRDQRPHVRLVLGLPDPERPGVPERLGPVLVERLVEALDLPRDGVYSMAHGRPSVLLALGQAELMDDRSAHVIVGGVDVLTNPRSLRALSAAGRLKEDWDGMLPSEAAAFFRVSTQRQPGWWGRPAARLVGVGTAVDPAANTKDDPLTGVGASRAFAAAVAGAGIDDATIDLRINDMNGERSAFEDDAMACTRFFRSRRPDGNLEVWHLGSVVGETGAAAGALEVLWAASTLELGTWPSRAVLLSCAEGPRRAAAVIMPADPTAGAGSPRARVSLDAPVVHPQAVTEPVVHPDPGLRLEQVDDAGRELAAQDLEQVASMLLIRAQHLVDPYEPWADVEDFEARLLRHVDALAWSRADAQPLAREILSDAQAEPERAAAAALVLAVTEIDPEAAELLTAAIPDAEPDEPDVAAPATGGGAGNSEPAAIPTEGPTKPPPSTQALDRDNPLTQPDGRKRDRAGRLGSPQRFALEIKMGPYLPDIDRDYTGAGLGPYATVFGKTNATGEATGQPRAFPMPAIAFDWQFVYLAGPLGLGTQVGLFRDAADAIIAHPVAGQNLRSSADRVTFTIIPLSLLLSYRFELLADRYRVPLVPYAKAGFAYSLFWSKGGSGNLSHDSEGKAARGGVPGWQVNLGGMFRLDVLEPGTAKKLDNLTGINHTYLFGEYQLSRVNNFGVGQTLNLGDSTWFAGLAIEF
ncbi:MAG: hypothetical protein KDK70_13560 [Myxococcales bacterium]|nr:hypothetical protein [Myxococcales bacterium]